MACNESSGKPKRRSASNIESERILSKAFAQSSKTAIIPGDAADSAASNMRLTKAMACTVLLLGLKPYCV